MFTREELTKKTNKQLEELTTIMGITGITGTGKDGKVIKPDYVNAILNHQGNNVSENHNSFLAIDKLRPALIAAHNSNNKHAITKNEAVTSGATEAQFKEWTRYVARLQAVADDYVTVNLENCPEDKKKEIYDRIFPIWREILKAGEENMFHPNMWVDKHDVVNIIHYDILDIASVNGTQRTTQTPALFRKGIETLVGLKIANNKVMTKENRDVLLAYQKAVSTSNRMDDRLKGDPEKHIVGLIENLNDLEDKLENAKLALESAQAEYEVLSQEADADATLMQNKWFVRTLDSITASRVKLTDEINLIKSEIGNVKKAKENAEKVKAEADKTIDENKAKAEEIQNALQKAFDIA